MQLVPLCMAWLPCAWILARQGQVTLNLAFENIKRVFLSTHSEAFHSSTLDSLPLLAPSTHQSPSTKSPAKGLLATSNIMFPAHLRMPRAKLSPPHTIPIPSHPFPCICLSVPSSFSCLLARSCSVLRLSPEFHTRLHRRDQSEAASPPAYLCSK